MMLLLLLAGCQSSPDKTTVISKNDGSFDAKMALSASEHHEPDATEKVVHADTFLSTDGSVEFAININEIIAMPDIPVLEVVPHYLTSEEVSRVATVIEQGVF